MKPIYLFLLISASYYTEHFASLGQMEQVTSAEKIYGSLSTDACVKAVRSQDNAPKLKITLPGAPQDLTWNTQMRYTISVSDPKDGESQYGEIDARACLMQVEYIPARAGMDVDAYVKGSPAEEHIGLSLMKRSTCFGCHADKSKLAGPSFEEIAAKYNSKSGIAAELGQHIIDGSSGIWGSQMMPSHPDLSLEEATQIADYILEQGANKNRWIYPGLEGTFRTIEKPVNHGQGVYVLTASYTSTSKIKGEHSVVFTIK